MKGDFITQKLRPMALVVAEVSRTTGVSATDILGKRRHPHIVRPRHMAMAICRDYCGATYPEIGRAFRRHHTSVMYAMDRIGALMSDDDLDDMEAIAKRCGLVEDAHG